MTIFTSGVIGTVLIVFEILGFVTAIRAVMSSRTPQGSIAWSIALILIPVISVPLYLVFGRSRFHGLVNARRAANNRSAEILDGATTNAEEFISDLGSEYANAKVLTELTHLPFLNGNDTRLLIDGEATFEAMFAAIERAKKQVVAEFYIVNDDDLGRRFKASLIDAAKRGCQVYLLFDEVGSSKLSKEYLADLRAARVRVSGMKATQGWTNRFQLNFRNHRKIVVVDGKCALIGGLNVGDEYVHKSKRLTPWRDTHMQIDGPAALAAQLAFAEDWLWATHEVPKLGWETQPAADADTTVFVLPSGPDDDYETCGLFFTHVINSATKRLWIASPYFVPDEGIVTALQLAAMRGVDVRILIPGLPDKWFVKQAAMSYVPQIVEAGIKMYEYGNGFLHQKVALVDDGISIIGTANFDNRSFRLNFEVSVVTLDEDFNSQVEQMLTDDFAISKLMEPEELAKRGLFFKVSSRVARLFAPIL